MNKKLPYVLPCITVFMWTFSFVGGQNAVAETKSLFHCGLARADITPAKPVQMSGYASRKDLSQGVHDPLSVRVIAFEKEGKKLVLVSTDVLGFYGGTAEKIRSVLLKRCPLAPSELFLCAIHTHAAPTVTLDEKTAHRNNVEYTQTLTGTIGDCIEAALQSMAPAAMGTGRGFSPIGMNRREKRMVTSADGSAQAVINLGRNPYGPTDKEVLVARISRWDGSPVAALFDYACHSTSLGPRNYLISGDILGLAEQCVEKILGGSLMAPAFAGACGDIDPWFRVLPEFNTEPGWIPEPVLLATLLGEEVVHTFRKIDSLSDKGTIRTSIATLKLPAKENKDFMPAEPREAELTITAACVGQVAFIGFGCEMLTEIGMAIKKASPFPYTFVITHCNGAAGYLPPADLYPEGGYEVQSSHFAPEAAEIVVRHAGKMLHALHAD
ncbi:MAG: neutral/alkaline non-lysosomal ceramidase N-terminal domain-containing protein [Sedimentisphaerales bacterium]|nr:neutral/alkaline non-lysosomal ceramidase N-terminal domain-containing protein [Sedimentisphaerales bacterium]